MSCIEQATVVIGVKALPGTYFGRNNNIGDIINCAVTEAKLLYDLGIRSIMVQNVNDAPAYNLAPVQTVAYMTAILSAIKNEIGKDCKLGVSILRNDTVACVAIASALNLDFVRAKVYVGEMMKMEREFGNMNEVLEMKTKLNCDVPIWADIHDRNGEPIGGVDLLKDCGFALRGEADSLIISGSNTLDTINLIKQVKGKFSNAKVIVGGGANDTNIADLMSVADGVIVASHLKIDGKIANPIDPERTNKFIEALLKA